jgi:NAD dependent epimerase/dehydratase
MTKKILVTGAAGFIGSHLVEKLFKDGYDLKILVPYNTDNSWGWIDSLDDQIKDNIEIISGDVCDQDLVRKCTRDINIIFHLAALISIPYSYVSPRSYISTNIIGTLNLLETLKDSNVELFVNTSTSEVYGSAQYSPIDEAHPLNAQSPYAATKISADQLSLSYYRSFELPITVLRPFNTFGPRQSLRASIPTIISQVLEKKKTIKMGNINTKRDFSYVSDTVSGFTSCINNKKCLGETINLGTGIAFTIEQTIKYISQLTNIDIKVEIDKNRLRPEKSEVNHLLSKNLKAKEILNWEPEFANEEGFKLGLQKTIEWFKKPENLKLYKSHIYNL